MENIFITELRIESVRHLKDICIPLPKDKKKHLILTGKNGSGKTSVLDAVEKYLDDVSARGNISAHEKQLEQEEIWKSRIKGQDEIKRISAQIQKRKDMIDSFKGGLNVKFNSSISYIKEIFDKGACIFAYYKADRIFKAEIPKQIQKINLKDKYTIEESPRKDFVKYLLDLKAIQAFAGNNGKTEKVVLIQTWFDQFDNLLKKVFDDPSVHLSFDEETFEFHILQEGKEPFDFNTLSSGYVAVLDIVLDIIMRMEKNTNRKFLFDIPGIVLIDEIENHLHLELQKRILDMLTTIFPNIQFIVSTHSPFVLNSRDDVVIYDLENKKLVSNGLTDIPYQGIVEGYFNVNLLSDKLKLNYERYEELTKKQKLTDEDFEEIAKLKLYLDEIPDYLAIGLTTEYQKLKMEFENREDI